MTAVVYAPFDFSEIGACAFTVTDSGGAKGVSLTTGDNAHINVSSVISTINNFPTRLQTAINGAPLAGTFTVTFNAATQKYTISSTATFSLTFSIPSVASRVLGFTGNKSGANTYTSDVAVWYAIGIRSGGITDANEYEIEGHAEDAYTEGGDHYGVHTAVPPVFFDFVAEFELKESVRERWANTGVAPWTWEHFWKHVRNTRPWVLQTTETVVLRMRAEAMNFRPLRAMRNLDTRWNLAFKAVVRGRV